MGAIDIHTHEYRDMKQLKSTHPNHAQPCHQSGDQGQGEATHTYTVPPRQSGGWRGPRVRPPRPPSAAAPRRSALPAGDQDL